MINRPKILIVENSLHITGAFNSAINIAKDLNETYEIEFVLPINSTLLDTVNRSGFICHLLPMQEIGRSWRKVFFYLPNLLINTIKLRRLLSNRGVAVLIINDYYNLLGVTARLIGWTGIIFTMVRLLPSNQLFILNWIWVRLGLIFNNQLIAVSYAVADQLPKHPKIVVIYNSVNLRKRDAYLTKLTRVKNTDLVQCLYIANYISGKGHDIALTAFSLAYHKCKKLRLKFVGGDMGLVKNKNIKNELIERVQKLNLSEVVDVCDFSNCVEDEINISDIVLNFSNSESFSQTCVEAAICGKPVIASRCGGPSEIIQDEISGLLVPIGDVNSMSSAILRLAQDSDLRVKMGFLGSAIVHKKFSKELFVSNFTALYQMHSQSN